MTNLKRELGDININDQVLIARTTHPGTDHLQYVRVLVSARRDEIGKLCGHRYGENGSDFHHPRFPACQIGAPGLSMNGLV